MKKNRWVILVAAVLLIGGIFGVAVSRQHYVQPAEESGSTTPIESELPEMNATARSELSITEGTPESAGTPEVSASETESSALTDSSRMDNLPTAVPTPTETPTRMPHITREPTAAPTFHAVTPAPTEMPEPWKETIIPPDCENAGTILRENSVEGIIKTESGEPALGHDWSAWSSDEDGLHRVCKRCGMEEKREHAYLESIPRIDFTGSMDGISKETRVLLGFRFESEDELFNGFSYTSWQGHATLGFPKKNYTIRLYDDEKLGKKHRFRFEKWQLEHKYVLKANYRDISMIRNLAAADLWADMVASRKNLYPGLEKTSNYGAVDGFPVTVYLNGEFHGLYTMNLHIDDDLFQMTHPYDAVMIANSSEPEETRFLSATAFADEKNAWEVEYCGTPDDSQWAKDSLNDLITFVMESDDEIFRARLGEKLDVDGAIDYLIFLYVTGLQSNAAKDLVLLKYQDWDPWIPSVYDMEGAFGLNLETVSYRNTEEFLPVRSEESWDSGTGSLLWDRLLQNFSEKIQSRYAELRQSVITEDKLVSRIQDMAARIPEEYREMDLTLYPRKESEQKPEQQMTGYILERLKLLDNTLISADGAD